MSVFVFLPFLKFPFSHMSPTSSLPLICPAHASVYMYCLPLYPPVYSVIPFLDSQKPLSFYLHLFDDSPATALLAIVDRLVGPRCLENLWQENAVDPMFFEIFQSLFFRFS